MESLSYDFEERGPIFTDDTDLQIDGLVKSKNLSQRWDGVESIGFVEPCLPHITQFLENSDDDKNGYSGNCVPSNSTITLNSSMEFGTIFSSSAHKANDEELVVPRKPNGKKNSLDNSVLSSREPLVLAKKARVLSCQVYGCNKDLSSSKDYHKKHKICDVHSKASLVIVNGIQQRFCQQCSRFHVLSEFDEVKRSCRKRLAGHNKRRRKPQFDNHFGSTFFGTDLSSKRSLFFSKLLPCMQIKLEEEPIQVSQQAMKFLNGFGQKYPSVNCPKLPLSVQDLSTGSNSSSALSLLSAESHNLLSSENYRFNLGTNQDSSRKFTPNIPLVPEASFCGGFEIPENGLSRESNALNLKRRISLENVKTVDLLELASHLQRVEQQKYICTSQE